jgi:threonine dehydrogenase-like Zn-dependent dehydrogenase
VNSEIDLNSCIAIFGDGPIALANVRFLVLRGFTNISVYGKYPFRLQSASALGAREVVNINSLDTFDVKELHEIDVCIVSSSADSLIKQLYSKFYPGTIIFEQTKISDVDLRDHLVANGSIFFRAFAYQISDFTEVISLIKTGSIETSKIITSKFTFEEFAQMYPSLLRKFENIKIAIVSNANLLSL